MARSETEPVSPGPEIEVIRVRRVSEPSTIRRLAASLSPPELGQAARCRSDVERDLHVTGRAALRRLLAERLGTSPAEVPLEWGPGDRPRAASSCAAWTCDLSHDTDWVVFALGSHPGRPGVHLERIDEHANVPSRAMRGFSTVEFAAWISLDPGVRVAAFFDAWSRKQAVLRCRHAGLVMDPRSISVEIDLRADPRRATSSGRGNCSVQRIAVPGYACALAVEGPTPTLRPLTWTFPGESPNP